MELKLLIFYSLPLETHPIANLSNAFNLDLYNVTILQPLWGFQESSHTTGLIRNMNQDVLTSATYLGVPVMITVPFLSVMPLLR